MISLDNFDKCAVTVDNVIFGFDEGDLKILLIKRGEPPFENHWGLPGYFVKADEGLDNAAKRVLSELTGLENVYLEQVSTFGETNRHPAGRVITVSFYSLVKISDYKINAASIALSIEWKSVSYAKGLAFDHDRIFKTCFRRLKQRVKSEPIGFELLPDKFTLTQLQHLYEAILETKLDKRNFRKKILSMDFLEDLEEREEKVAHRPAKLYKFNETRYQESKARGMVFDISESKKKIKKDKLDI